MILLLGILLSTLLILTASSGEVVRQAKEVQYEKRNYVGMKSVGQLLGGYQIPKI